MFVLNLPPDCNEEGLRLLFSSFGNVLSTLVYLDKVTKQSKQFGLRTPDIACVPCLMLFLKDL